jgi:hypothetical protein
LLDSLLEILIIKYLQSISIDKKFLITFDFSMA